ncbi:putative copper-exporting P-type ATPase V [Planctomycetes bacterium Pla163]|uniref:P-type Zn(2+) transporter n=1 Tax=Rohdeia mirabilis TaxID=2528008 RepID=A0A518CXD8_9BACT|nr:putative copper-exporting P-type ATPase V [Planctomycetes bacterium Pla163]
MSTTTKACETVGTGHDPIEAPLTTSEKRRIGRQLGPLMFGTGLFALGALYAWLVPDQADVAAVLQAIGAVTVGLPIFREALEGFLARPTRNLTEQLVAIAVFAALVTGEFMVATLVPLFLELGHLFEERSSRGARAAIDGILALHARRAHRVRPGAADGEELEEVDPEQLAVGDVVVVRPGEVIPCDGEVVGGRSSVDSSPITGESLYDSVQPGSRVYSGTINLDGLLSVRATTVGSASVLGRVVELLQSVESSKTPVLRLLDRFSGSYIPLVLAVAGIVLFATGEMNRAIAVLIVACPCGLVLAGPAAMVASMTAASRLRLLIKSSEFIETSADITTLVLDKTGTVTSGRLAVDALVPVAGVESERLLAAAGTCGQASLHPVSVAAVAAARARGLVLGGVDETREIPGSGVEVRATGGTRLRLGRRTWLEAAGVSFEGAGADDGGPGAWVAEGDRLLGFVALRDTPRSEARSALDLVRRLGIERIVLLTGDREGTAKVVADELGFDDYVAEVLPEQKLDIVRQEQARARGKVMMVGDGVNDALALSGADVGVALGARVNEVAVGGADVALMSGDLGRIPRMLHLADRTRATIVSNALLATGWGVAMVALASLGILAPAVAALLHNGGVLLVLVNSARLVRLGDAVEETGPYLAPAALVPSAAPEADGAAAA